MIILRSNKEECRVGTIIVRGSTNTLMDDVERTINDCINTVKCIIRDNRFLPGAGAIEIVILWCTTVTTPIAIAPGIADTKLR